MLVRRRLVLSCLIDHSIDGLELTLHVERQAVDLCVNGLGGRRQTDKDSAKTIQSEDNGDSPMRT